MEHQLYFLNIFPVVDLGGATTFSYFRDDINAEDDIQTGVMSEPLPVSELGKLSTIDISTISRKSGDTYQFGYAFEYSEAKLKENGFVDEIARAYDRIAYGMSRTINRDIFNFMDENAGATPIDLNDGVWDTSAQINDDIIDMKYTFEDVEGWDYTLTDAFVNTNQFRAMNKFYSALEGSFTPNDCEGVAFTNTKTTIDNGTLYGIDRQIKPITIYKNVNPKHSTMEGGLINVSTSVEDRYPFTSRIEVWAEMGLACKHPKAILKQTGLTE
ncbi:hypothetical protein [Methanobrevibacter sp.]